MFNRDRSVGITFNGEIYNYRDLRAKLERKGYPFRSNSDTEVLLHLYADRGVSMVDELRGMFAFAVWDGKKEEMLIARDPLGIKPLYYSDDGWTFRFASQVKGLLAGEKVSRDLEPAGAVGFYLWGSVPEPFTMFQSIRALPAGCTMRISRIGAHEPIQYFSVPAVYTRAEEAAREAHDGKPREAHRGVLRAALLESVSQHLVSDVAVGAFLSAGVDSNALVALMRAAGQDRIQTVTIAFDEFQGKPEDEGPLAEELARYHGSLHTKRIVTQAEFQEDLPKIIAAMDQPTIDGINTWFVSKAASELGLKVAISGLGADEMFGGYPSFENIPRCVRLMQIPCKLPGIRSARIIAGQVTRMFGLSPKSAGIFELGGTYAGAYLLQRGIFMPWELTKILHPDLVREGLVRLDPVARIDKAMSGGPKGAFGRVAALELSNYMRNQLLRDTDWASMAHGLEVRVPFVDRTLLEQVAVLFSTGLIKDGKSALAEVPQPALPPTIRDRAKTGFSTPIASWQKLMASERQQNRTPAQLTMDTGGNWARKWALEVASSSALSSGTPR
jgi:asparagine synthase (glutamine-hydrolysing)